jgi:PKD repeat protein
MRTIAIALILAFVMAGCAGSTDDGTGTGTATGTATTGTGTGTKGTGTTTGTQTGTGTTTTGTQTPAQKAALLTPSVTAGQAPLNVTFQVDASSDRAGATWSLDFGDGSQASTGTALPDTATHVYTVAGNFSANLTVTFKDGQKRSKSVQVAITEAGAGGSSNYHGKWEDTVAFAIPFGYEGEHEAAFNNAHAQSSANGTFTRWYDIPVTDGAKALRVTTNLSPTACTVVLVVCLADCDVWVKDPAGEYSGGTNDGDCLESFEMLAPPAGTYWVFVNLWFGAEVKIPIEIEVVY